MGGEEGEHEERPGKAQEEGKELAPHKEVIKAISIIKSKGSRGGEGEKEIQAKRVQEVCGFLREGEERGVRQGKGKIWA